MRAHRILVVEDEMITAMDLQDQLIRLGYDVPDPVASGDHALRAIEEARPDLILMDININGDLDGIETASRIPASYGIPIVYLTAYSDDATIARANATNPHGYLLKPVAERDLHAMTMIALPLYPGERANEEPPACTGPNPDDQQIGDLLNRAPMMAWRKSGNSLFASVPSRRAGVRYHLIVEPLPHRDVWDWAVWRSGDSPEITRHGQASSSTAAMDAASERWADMAAAEDL